MATLNDGGPAFPKPLDPYPNAQGMESGTLGMSLRDWFAGQALPWTVRMVMEISPRDLPAIATKMGLGQTVTPYDIAAASAYRSADAMLRARALPTDGGEQ